MRDNAEMIANLDPFGPPLIADMDTGYGGEFIIILTKGIPEDESFITNPYSVLS